MTDPNSLSELRRRARQAAEEAGFAPLPATPEPAPAEPAAAPPSASGEDQAAAGDPPPAASPPPTAPARARRTTVRREALPLHDGAFERWDVRVSPEVKRRLRIMAIEQRRRIQDLVQEALEAYVRVQGPRG